MSDEATPPIDIPEIAAFNEAAGGFEVAGIELYPRSMSRIVAADAMGFRWGYVSPDDGLLKSTGFKYSGALADTCLMLWLCSIPNASEAKTKEEWTVQRAQRNPDAANLAAQEWAYGLGIVNAECVAFLFAFGVLHRIMAGETVSRFKIEVTGAGPQHEETEPGNELAPPDALS
jgi:hypothetical protein